MSESSAPAPSSGNGFTNLILIVGIAVLSWSILKAGEAKDQPASKPVVTLSDDFWMNLPTDVKKLRDELAIESESLNTILESVADKQKQASESEDDAVAGKLNDEIEGVVAAQETKVKNLQKEYFRRLHVLRQGYIARKEGGA